MQIKDFYIIPETMEEIAFVDSNIKFILDLSLRQKKYLSLSTYSEMITERFNDWKEEKIENGKF